MMGMAYSPPPRTLIVLGHRLSYKRVLVRAEVLFDVILLIRLWLPVGYWLCVHIG